MLFGNAGKKETAQIVGGAHVGKEEGRKEKKFCLGSLPTAPAQNLFRLACRQSAGVA